MSPEAVGAGDDDSKLQEKGVPKGDRALLAKEQQSRWIRFKSWRSSSIMAASSKSHSSPDLVHLALEPTTPSIGTGSLCEDDKADDSTKRNQASDQPSVPLRSRSRSNVLGQVVVLSRDYQGCRFLQECLEDGGRPIFDVIFSEVMFEAAHLARHASANYLCQKLIEKCCQKERYAFLAAVKKQIASLCLNMHGTRVVQKLIDLGSLEEEVCLISAQIRPSFDILCQDPNGIHCIQSCLSVNGRYNGGYNWIFETVAAQCKKLSTNSISCCVVQKCIEQAMPYYRTLLAKAVTDHALDLVTDPFGNYVVQNVLDIDDRCITRTLVSKLTGSAYQLAILKFSSNVIEKCLQNGDEDLLEVLLNQLFQGGEGVGTVLCDPYGNYCVQAALRVYEGSSQEKFDHLIARILPFMPLLELTTFRKRIYAKMLKRFPALNPHSKETSTE